MAPLTGPHVTGLRCRACAHVHDARHPWQACERCWGPLEVAYDLTRACAAVGRGLGLAPGTEWPYGPLLGAPDPGSAGAGVGATPLVPAPALGAALGAPLLHLKDERANPSGSFKDRLVIAALAVARARGARVAACASTGNLATSLASMAPRFGMRWVAILPTGTDPARAAALARSPAGAAVVVDGDYDRANRLGGEVADEHPDWAWVNVGLRAWYADGARPLAFEVAEQLGWNAPDRIVVPMASGATAVQLARAFEDLHACGLTASVPRLTVVQPGGCAPVARAWERGTAAVEPVRPATVAASLSMGDPPDGPDVIAAARRTGGTVVEVPEEDIVGGGDRLRATVGMDADPAAGVAVAALARLAARGVVQPDERVVLYVTGASPPAMTGADAPAPVAPTVRAVEDAVAHLLT